MDITPFETAEETIEMTVTFKCDDFEVDKNYDKV